MRTMVKFTIPTQEANPLVKDGSIGQTMDSLMGNLQPEAAYFGPIDGKRGGFIVINMEEGSGLDPLWWTPESLEAKPSWRESTCRRRQGCVTRKSSRPRPSS